MENQIKPLTHNIASSVLTILFGVSLGYFAYPTPIFRYMAVSFVVFLLIALGYNAYFYGYEIRKYFWQIVLIMIGYGSLGIFFFLAPNEFLQILFFIIALPAIYFQQSLIANGSESLLSTRFILLSAPFFLAISAAANFYFKISGALYIAVVFIFCFFVTRGTYEYTPLGERAKYLNALVVSVITCQLVWALAFLPFHYSVLGLIAFFFYYFIWQLDYSSIFKTFNLKKALFTGSLLLVLVILLLLSTPWSVLS